MDEFEDFNPKNWSFREENPFWFDMVQDLKELPPFVPQGFSTCNDFMKELIDDPSDFGPNGFGVLPSIDFGVVPSIDLGMDDEFLQINLDKEYESLVSEINVDNINHDVLNSGEIFNILPDLNEVPNEIFTSDSEDEKKFGHDALRIVDLNDVLNLDYASKENQVKPEEWWLADHNYCLDRGMEAKVKPHSNKAINVDTKKNTDLETNIDVWGPSREALQAFDRSRVFNQPTLTSRFQDMKSTRVNPNVTRVKKSNCNKRSLSEVGDPQDVEDLCVALTNSGSRRSLRNRPKGSVETTPSGSDFEDGYYGHLRVVRPRKRICAISTVNQASNKLTSSKLNVKGESRRSKTRPAKPSQTLSKLPPLQLGYEGSLYPKDKSAKQIRASSQSVGQTSKKTKNRTTARTPPKQTKQKSLKDKQGHKDNEKLRRDKLRDAFIQLKNDIPLSYLVDNVEKPPTVISKQRTLNGAVKRISELSVYKRHVAKTFVLYYKVLRSFTRKITKSRTVKKMHLSPSIV